MSTDTTATTRISQAMYCLATGLTAVLLGAMGAPTVMPASAVLETVVRLGYPPHLATILGVVELAAAAVVTSAGRASRKGVRRRATADTTERGPDRSRLWPPLDRGRLMEVARVPQGLLAFARSVLRRPGLPADQAKSIASAFPMQSS